MSGRQLGGGGSPSFLRLLMVMALTCLAPVLALVVVGAGSDDGRDDDNVTAAGRTPPSSLVAEAPQAQATTAAPATTTTTATPAGEASPAKQAPAATTASTATSTAPVTEPPTTAPPTTAAPAPAPTAPAARTAAQQVVDLVNAQRAAAAHPCRPLSVDGRLATAAQRHSDDMAAHDYFSHTSRNGATAQDRAEAAGFNGLVGENIAAGQRSPQDVMSAWMGSAGHRANILNCNYTVIGVGLNKDGWYWTQMFGTPS